jgi:hypothetical protein
MGMHGAIWPMSRSSTSSGECQWALAADLCGPADAFCAGDCVRVVFSTFLAVSQDEASRTLLQDLTVAYWVCMSLAALISLVSVGYKAYG